MKQLSSEKVVIPLTQQQGWKPQASRNGSTVT